MNYTKGETAGGWIHVLGNGKPIGLIHPKHIDKFLAVDDLYEAVRWVLEDYQDKRAQLSVSTHTQLLKALSKAE